VGLLDVNAMNKSINGIVVLVMLDIMVGNIIKCSVFWDKLVNVDLIIGHLNHIISVLFF